MIILSYHAPCPPNFTLFSLFGFASHSYCSQSPMQVLNALLLKEISDLIFNPRIKCNLLFKTRMRPSQKKCESIVSVWNNKITEEGRGKKACSTGRNSDVVTQEM